jgi:hypothetical protein
VRILKRLLSVTLVGEQAGRIRKEQGAIERIAVPVPRLRLRRVAEYWVWRAETACSRLIHPGFRVVEAGLPIPKQVRVNAPTEGRSRQLLAERAVVHPVDQVTRRVEHYPHRA